MFLDMHIVETFLFFIFLSVFCINNTLHASHQKTSHEVHIVINKKNNIAIQLCTLKRIQVEESLRVFLKQQKEKIEKKGDYGGYFTLFVSDWAIPTKKVADFIETVALLAKMIKFYSITFQDIHFLRKESEITLSALLQKKLLLDNIVVSDKSNNTILHYLFYKRDLNTLKHIEPILDNRGIHSTANRSGNLPIHLLFQQEQKKDKQNMIELFGLFYQHTQQYLPFIINHQNTDKEAVLHLVCKKHHHSVIKAVLSCKEVDISRKNKYNKTPFSVYLSRIFKDPDILLKKHKTESHEELIRIFIKRGGDPEQSRIIIDKEQNTPYHMCAALGLTGLLNALCCGAKNINVQNKNGDTPFHLAIIYEEWKIIDTLWAMGCSFEIKNKDGKTPFDILYLKLQQTKYPEDYITLKMILTTFLSYDIDPNIFRDPNGNSLLHFACMKNDPDLVAALLTYNMQLEIQNKQGETAFHILFSSPLVTNEKKMKSNYSNVRRMLMPRLTKNRDLLKIKNNESITVWDLIQSNENYTREWDECLKLHNKTRKISKHVSFSFPNNT